MEALGKLGCDELQGNYFTPPTCPAKYERHYFHGHNIKKTLFKKNEVSSIANLAFLFSYYPSPTFVYRFSRAFIGLCEFTLSFTIIVVTGASEYLLKSISCPTQRPTAIFISVFSLLSTLPCPRGLQLISKLSEFFSIPSSPLSIPPFPQTTD